MSQHKSEPICRPFPQSALLHFTTFFKDSLCLGKLTDLDKKGAKRSVKMWATNFFQECVVLHELWAVKDSFSTYVCTVYSCGVNCTCFFFHFQELQIFSIRLQALSDKIYISKAVQKSLWSMCSFASALLFVDGWVHLIFCQNYSFSSRNLRSYSWQQINESKILYRRD